MAQPTQFVMKYSGALTIDAGEKLLGSSLPSGTVMQMKSNGIKVSINGDDAFDIIYDDLGTVDVTATYTFDKKCTIAYGVMTEVV